jgi:hypothetical protein
MSAAMPQDRLFIALMAAYRPHRGISRLHWLSGGGRVRVDGLDTDIGALVSERRMLAFPWDDEVWVPMFQFDVSGPVVSEGPRRVVAEWSGALDGWALADWFVRPNSWLGQHKPIELIDSGLPDVLEAVRADRFVATT